MIGVETKIDNMQKRLESIDKMLMGKIEEYNQTMEDVGTNVQAMEKVMKNLVPSLSESVKELRGMKKKKKSK